MPSFLQLFVSLTSVGVIERGFGVFFVLKSDLGLIVGKKNWRADH